MRETTITIDSRFCGPPQSANGGYACGRLASFLPGTSKVRLKAPPPLGVELRAEIGEHEARLFDGPAVLAEAQLSDLDTVAPPPPSFEQAIEASKSYPGFVEHFFPTCFVCGPDRQPGDGMRIFPGDLPGQPVGAAPWVPDASFGDETGHVRPEFIWSALDCPTGYCLIALPKGTAALLGELAVRIDGPVSVGEKCVVLGWSLGIDGRKYYGGSALYSESGRPVAVAKGTWISLPASALPPAS